MVFDNKEEYKKYWVDREKQEKGDTVTNNEYLSLKEKDRAIKIAQVTKLWEGFFLPHLAQGYDHILDFGCGRGRFTGFLSEHSSKSTGLDMTAGLLDRAIEAHAQDNIDFKLYDGEVFPFEDNTFDLIFSCTVLQHIVIPDVLESVVKEFQRVLAPGGKLLLFEGCEKNRGAAHVFHRDLSGWRELFPWATIEVRKTYCEIGSDPTHLLMEGVKNV